MIFSKMLCTALTVFIGLSSVNAYPHINPHHFKKLHQHLAKARHVNQNQWKMLHHLRKFDKDIINRVNHLEQAIKKIGASNNPQHTVQYVNKRVEELRHQMKERISQMYKDADKFHDHMVQGENNFKERMEVFYRELTENLERAIEKLTHRDDENYGRHKQALHHLKMELESAMNKLVHADHENYANMKEAFQGLRREMDKVSAEKFDKVYGGLKNLHQEFIHDNERDDKHMSKMAHQIQDLYQMLGDFEGRLDNPREEYPRLEMEEPMEGEMEEPMERERHENEMREQKEREMHEQKEREMHEKEREMHEREMHEQMEREMREQMEREMYEREMREQKEREMEEPYWEEDFQDRESEPLNPTLNSDDEERYSS